MQCKPKTFVLLVTLLAAMIVLTGCEKKKPEPAPVVKRQATPEPQFEFAGEEIYGDPEIFSTPRIQFVWQAPGHKREEIWSMRLDGGDLRRVVKAEMIPGGIDHDPVRSPDNRYVIISSHFEKLLVDLKTQTKTVIMRGGYNPHFTWRPDGQRVVFVSDPGLMEYNVDTKELKTLKEFRSYGQYILNDGRFVVMMPKGLEYYTADQKFIRSVDLFTKKEIASQNELTGFFHRISKDGRFMVYELGNKTHFIRLDDSKKSMWITDKWFNSGCFGPTGKYFFYSIRRINLETKEEVKLFDPTCIVSERDCGGVPGHTTIYNLGAVR